MCRILRVWKLKTSINTSHLLGFGNGRLWEAKSIVFYTLRAGPPTQLSLVRVSF